MVTKMAGRGLGIVTLDRKGRYGVAHNTPHLCWAGVTKNRGLVSQLHRWFRGRVLPTILVIFSRVFGKPF